MEPWIWTILYAEFMSCFTYQYFLRVFMQSDWLPFPHTVCACFSSAIQCRNGHELHTVPYKESKGSDMPIIVFIFFLWKHKMISLIIKICISKYLSIKHSLNICGFFNNLKAIDHLNRQNKRKKKNKKKQRDGKSYFFL